MPASPKPPPLREYRPSTQSFTRCLPSIRPSRSQLRLLFLLVAGLILFETLTPTYDTTLFNTSRWIKPNRARAARRRAGRRKVAVFDDNGFHDEVHGAILYTLTHFPDIDVLFYRKPWRYDFARTISSFWSEAPRPPSEFRTDIQDPDIDTVIMTTCDWDYKKVREDMAAEWERRDADHKFNLVCLRHWTHDLVTQEMEFFAERNALSMVGLGGHVVDYLEETIINSIKRSGVDTDKGQGFAGMKSKVFIPTFLPDQQEGLEVPFNRTAEGSNQVSIGLLQSTFWDENHRALNRTFTDLLAALQDDPSIWGYAHPIPPSQRYTVLPDSKDPFRLVFLGAGVPPIPEALREMTVVSQNVAYPMFYELLSASDIIIPAFGTDGYEKNRASSTVGVAATAMASILITEAVRDLYGYFCPYFAIIRPPGMGEIEYIRQLRAKQIQWPSREEMTSHLSECREEWRLQNMETMADLLAGKSDETMKRRRLEYISPQ